jgi:1-deoxy-D-xylulose-5-phosphate reductoisomerase
VEERQSCRSRKLGGILMRRRVAVLGSTGSIGTQTLDVVRAWSELFEVVTLTANNNWQLLASQACEFMPDSVVIARVEHLSALREALSDLPVKVYAGEDAVAQVAVGGEIDVVVNAVVGFAGLAATAAALTKGTAVALANKESLVVAGEALMPLSMKNNAPIIPVDSEHSAIFQCLQGEVSPVEKIILTASGGAFRDMPAGELADVTPAQALRHPNWTMGRKVTIDSATMMNKGFEVIEARWLFGVPHEKIEVLVHPQSVVHSMVELADGAVMAQLGTPDMHLPIQYALTYPQRLPLGGERLKLSELTFREPDMEKYPCLGLAYDALKMGGNAGCTLNAANEAAVEAFLGGRIKFTDIARVARHTMERAAFVKDIVLSDCAAYHAEATRIAQEYMQGI